MQDELFSVAEQVVLVSGGSRGIGRAIAAGFAERGARVIVTGRQPGNPERTADELRARGGDATPMLCDVTDLDATSATVEKILDGFGRIDTLVNVAGINRRGPAAETTREDYDAVLDTNLRGAFFLSQIVGKSMCSRGSGRQINITSLANDRPLRHAGPYAMSKAGLGQMTRALALEWGPHGVNVNAIAPGFILTDLTKPLWSDSAMQSWNQANTPQGRLGTPDDVVGTAVFLASEASRFVTGQVIYVDGGFSAGWSWPIPE